MQKERKVLGYEPIKENVWDDWEEWDSWDSWDSWDVDGWDDPVWDEIDEYFAPIDKELEAKAEARYYQLLVGNASDEFPVKSRKFRKAKHDRDNTPKYKALVKSRKANRELARERRNEQLWMYRDPDHGNYDLVPYYPEKPTKKSRKANERFESALGDEWDVTREQAKNLAETEVIAEGYVESRKAKLKEFYEKRKQLSMQLAVIDNELILIVNTLNEVAPGWREWESYKAKEGNV